MELKKWSRHFEQCVQCKDKSREHVAHGLCKLCFSRKWAAAHVEHLKAYKYQWYLAHGGPLSSKLRREQFHFDGIRESILKRDNYKCTQCKTPYLLVVHHKDGNGRGSKKPNNKPSNLTTLCKACHIEAHRAELQKARGFSGFGSWSKKYGLDKCSVCNRSDEPHNAKGMCVKCYSMINRKL